MPVTVATARAAVRAANAAGKQVIVTRPDGSQVTGTARFQLASSPECTLLRLFGVTNTAGPYTAVPNSNLIAAPPLPGQGQANYFLVGTGPTVAPYTSSTAIALADITAIGTTPANSPTLLPATPGPVGGSSTPAQTNDVDPTVGTKLVNGNRVPDLDFVAQHGTGLE